MGVIAGMVAFDCGPLEARDVIGLFEPMASMCETGVSLQQPKGALFGAGNDALSAENCIVGAAFWSLGSLHLVVDARLDNQYWLRQALRCPEAGTAELVLEAVRTWGVEGACQRLHGDFAFAVWDAESNNLWLARDHVGARNLYYHQRGGQVVFASRECAFHACRHLTLQPNQARLASYLIPGYGCYDSDESWLEGVYFLPAGTVIKFNAQGKVTSSYWEPTPSAAVPKGAGDDVIEAFLEVFTSAVTNRTQEPNTGLLLSGGIDSQLVIAASRQTENGPPATFSLVRRGMACAETANILTSADENAYFLDVGPKWKNAYNAPLCDSIWSAPHPSRNSVPSVQLLAQIARSRGIRTLLSGVSGDLALYSPSDHLAFLVASGNFSSALKEIGPSRRFHTYGSGLKPSELGWDIARRVLNRSPLVSARHSIDRQRSERRLREAGVSKRTIEVLRHQKSESQLLSRAAMNHAGREHAYALSHGSVERGLRGYGEACRQAGLDHADPWAAPEVLEFCLGLPYRWRSGGGWTKRIARISGSRWLPDIAWHSGKVHLGSLLIEHALSVCPPSFLRPQTNYFDAPCTPRGHASLCAHGPFGQYSRAVANGWLDSLTGARH